MIGRRRFIGLLGGAAMWPLPVLAQRRDLPVIGFLRPLPPTAFPETLNAFKQGLSELGYSEGQNVVIEHRWSSGNYEQLSALAAELVHRAVSVIFTGGGAITALAAKAATKKIPVVFVVGDDPIRSGIVSSLNQPDANVTGATLFGFDLEQKKFEILAELVPHAEVIAMLRNPNAPEASWQNASVGAAATKLGRKVHVLDATRENEIDAVFASLPTLRAGALLVVNDVYFSIRSAQIIALAERYAIPTIFDFRHHVVAGGLLSYGSSLTAAYQDGGTYCGRILRGETPGSLPVLQPTKFELVVNLRTAKALGLEFPPTLLARADEVIE